MAPLADERASFGNAKAAPDPYKLLDDAAPGGDFLDSLLGSAKPTGPGQFRKTEEFVELLPPLGDDGPLLGPSRDLPSQPAMRDHSASITDSFLPAGKVAAKSVIPDDWDDLLAPTPPAKPAQPQALPPEADVFSHGPARQSAKVPDDDIFGDPVASPPATLPEDDSLEDLAPKPAVVSAAVLAPLAPDFGDLSAKAPPEASGGAMPADPFATFAKPFDPFATDPNRKSGNGAGPAASAFVAAQASMQTVVPPVQTAAAAPAGSAPVAVPQPAAPAYVAPPQPVCVGAGMDPARVFLMAVGAEDLRISDTELPETMARLGRTLKSMITGLREILMTRTSIKSEFRIEQTMVNVGGNNPLKFSVSPEQAIEAMVKPTARGYLPAEAAALQALEDVKAHEIAMVTGMEAALKGVLGKLNPASLTTKIEAKGGFGGFLKNRKAQYWETYEAMYAEISDQAENDFHELFAKEFAQAYRAQLARLKEAKTQG